MNALLDAHSCVADRPGAHDAAVAETARLRAVTSMPVLPHIDEVIAVLAVSGQNTEPIWVAAFVDNGLVDVPRTDESCTVRF